MRRSNSMTSPALAARRYEEAKAGVLALIAAGETGATGLAIFGEAFRNSWGYVLMKRLRDRGLVIARPGAALHGPNSKLIFVASAALRSAAEDDHVLGELVFPGSVAPLPRFQGSSDDAEPEEDAAASGSEPEARTEALLREDADDEEAAAQAALEEAMGAETSGELLEAIVKISAAVLENVVYLRRKVDAMEAEIQSLRQAWE